jgi:hypothetical protein
VVNAMISPDGAIIRVQFVEQAGTNIHEGPSISAGMLTMEAMCNNILDTIRQAREKQKEKEKENADHRRKAN